MYSSWLVCSSCNISVSSCTESSFVCWHSSKLSSFLFSSERTSSIVSSSITGFSYTTLAISLKLVVLFTISLVVTNSLGTSCLFLIIRTKYIAKKMLVINIKEANTIIVINVSIVFGRNKFIIKKNTNKAVKYKSVIIPIVNFFEKDILWFAFTSTIDDLFIKSVNVSILSDSSNNSSLYSFLSLI